MARYHKYYGGRGGAGPVLTRRQAFGAGVAVVAAIAAVNRKSTGRVVAGAVHHASGGAGTAAAGLGGGSGSQPSTQPSTQPSEPPGAATAIAFARAQLGKPYVYGATGPDAWDCSGLTQAAWAAAGVSIPRTSEDQWAYLPHVPGPEPGYLVFFPGSDGTWTSPGHVALVISATQMIQAYATGYPVMISPLNGDGAGGLIGYARAAA